ncbi:tRNA (guanine(10)-N(2))-methyltransferase homolog [Amphiura filiformis]|uniref:tRNA (guanine(10)-N(2))-methyltransferase homolog n=1 Tax=Amphiura filiformis TaxID=82378 RepID=UPI003B2216FA
MRQYLLIFAQEHIGFRLPELRCLLSLLKIKAEYDDRSYDGESPFLPIKLTSEKDAKLLMSRSMLAKSLIELWGHGSSRDEAGKLIESQWQEEWQQYCQEDVSICFRVNPFGKQINIKDKIDIMEEIAKYLPLEGPVKLTNPDQLFHIYEYYGLNPNEAPPMPLKVYVGRWIADGQRHLVHRYSIKKRHFIGNTSMDATLALIMANMANVTPNMVIFDPFVGTGSLLVGAAHFGAFTLGSDINANVIHGKGKTSRNNTPNKFRGDDENIRTNMRMYGLESRYIDVLITDFSKNVWREQPMFDAIITDPPYGLRESTKKVGTEKSYKIREEQVEAHIPATLGYGLGDILTDLLEFAVHFLRLHGRLVYWMPTARSDYTDDMIPHHPCLKLVANSEQILTSMVSRRLITMEKCKNLKDLDGYPVKAAIRDNKYQQPNALRDKVYNTGQSQDSDTELQESTNSQKDENVKNEFEQAPTCR